MLGEKFDQHYFNWQLAEEKDSLITKSIVNHILKCCRKEGKSIKDLTVLDVGSGVGQFSFEIGRRVKKMVGVEPFREAYISALDKKRKYGLGRKIIFWNVPIEKLKTKEKFDLILSLTTLEHMPDAEKSFKKVFELLKNGGIIYLTVPNKLWPYEYHYKLWFLSWLPLKYANYYVRLMKKGKSFGDSAYAPTYFGLRKFFDKFPCRYKFIVPDASEKFLGLGDRGFFYSFMKNVGLRLLKRFPIFWIFSKAFIVVITKN
jgi:2-polyprenyl-3-methyl-5-hydroxy-6-metoxy-1,4-benzoquinol methylase